MSKTDPAASPKPRRRRFLKGCLVALLSVAALLLAAFFYVSSHAFFSQWIQPRVEDALGRPIEIVDYDLSLFGRLALGGVTVGATEGEDAPPLEVERFELRCKPLAVARGNWRIERLHASGVRLRLRRDADGVLHGPFPVAAVKPDSAEPEEPDDGKPAENPLDALAQFRYRIEDVVFEDVTATYEAAAADGAPARAISILDLNLSCPLIASGEDWTLEGDARVEGVLPAAEVAAGPPAPAVPGGSLAEEGFSGRFDLQLTQTVGSDDDPSTVTGVVALRALNGEAAGQRLDEAEAVFSPRVGVTPEGALRLSGTQLTVASGGAEWTRLTIDGEVDPLAGALDVRLKQAPVDRRVLNLLAPPEWGVDFRDATVRLDANLRCAEAWRPERAGASLEVENFNAAGGPFPAGGFPATRLVAYVDVQFVPDEEAVYLNLFAVDVMRVGGAKLLTASLDKPMAFDEKTLLPVAEKMGDNALRVRLHDMDLAPWAVFVPAEAPLRLASGTVGGTVALRRAEDAPDAARVEAQLNADGLTGEAQERAFGPLAFALDFSATVDASQRLRIAPSVVSVERAGEALGRCTLEGDVRTREGEGELTAEIAGLDLAQLPLAALGAAPVRVERGGLSAKGELAFSKAERRASVDASATLSKADLAPRAESGEALRGLDATFTVVAAARFDEAGAPARLDVSAFSASARAGQRNLGAASADGTMDLAASTGRINMDVVDADLKPFLALLGAAPPAVMPREAVLGGRWEITAPEKDVVRLKGVANLRPFVLPPPGGEGPDLVLPASTRLDVEARLAEKRADVDLETTLGDPDAPDGMAAVKGTLRSGGAHLGGEMDVRAEDFRLAAAAPFLGGLNQTVNLSEASLDGRETVRLNEETGEISVEGSATVSGLRPAKAPGAPPTRVVVETNAALLDSELTLSRLALTIPGETEGSALCTGALTLGEPPSGTLMLEAQRLALQPLLAYGGIVPAEGAPPLDLTNFKTQIALEGPRIRATGVEGAIAEGVFSAAEALWDAADAARPRLVWTNARGEGLKAETLAMNLAGVDAETVQGTVQFDASGETRLGEADPLAALRGRTTLQAADGLLSELPITRRLAATLRMPALRTIEFQSMDAAFDATPEAVQIEKIDIRGFDQKIGADGTIGHDRRLDVALRLALGGALRDRVADKSYARYLKTDADGYLAFPVPLGVGGTLEDPSVKIQLPTESLLDLGASALEERLRGEIDGDGEDASTTEDADGTTSAGLVEEPVERRSTREEAEDALEEAGRNLLEGLLNR